MSKKKKTYDVFVRLIVPETVEKTTIEKILHRAAEGQGWDFSASVEEEDESMNVLLSDNHAETDGEDDFDH